MEKKKKKNNHIVKILTIASTVALVFILTVLPISANTASTGPFGATAMTYTCGLPFDLYFETYGVPSGDLTSILPSANVYVSDGVTTNYVDIIPDEGQTYDITYHPTFSNSTHDIGIVPSNPSAFQPTYAVSHSVFSIPYDATQNQLQGIVSKFGADLTFSAEIGGNLVVKTAYDVLYSWLDENHELQTGTVTYRVERTLVANSGTYNVTRMRTSDLAVLRDEFGIHERDIIVTKVQTHLEWNEWKNITAVYIDDYQSPQTTIGSIMRDSYETLYNSLYEDFIIDFEDISFSGWIKNSVASFMNFEILPGISFAGVLAVVLGIPLLLWFLKLFAGG